MRTTEMVAETGISIELESGDLELAEGGTVDGMTITLEGHSFDLTAHDARRLAELLLKAVK
jgi:hypothetical protein